MWGKILEKAILGIFKADPKINELGGVPEGPGEDQGQGQEDQGEVKELGGTPPSRFNVPWSSWPCPWPSPGLR